MSDAEVPAYAHYRPADTLARSCGTCTFLVASHCTMFPGNPPVQEAYTCDEWDGTVDKGADVGWDAHDRVSDMDRYMVNEALQNLEPTRKAAGALYLISHAKTRYNRPGEAHDIVQGWRNIPIDSTGREQARKLGKTVKDAGVEHIYSSDLQRGKQTAEIMGRVAGVPVTHHRAYRPWNLGSFAGHSSSDVVPKLKPFMDDHPEKPVDGGESFNEYKNRFIPALEKLLKQVDQGKTVALVTHSRNVELAQGWLGGKGHRSKIDTEAISQDKIPPAHVFKVTPHGRKLALVEVEKGQAFPVDVRLRVNGMSHTPDGQLVYRMVTRDGHYVGRTNPTRARARKGDTLSVAASHFALDPQGDPYWLNPVVRGQSPDAPHSWRDLEALAGKRLVKDYAPDAAEAPDPGDASNMAAMVSDVPRGIGPTIETVHVNAPLKNISVSYATAGKKKLLTLEPGEAMLQVHKADKAQQLVYGVVLEPNRLDSQDDFMRPEDVESAAHRYMKNTLRGQASVTKLQHLAQGFFKKKPGVTPVESFIAPCDFKYDGSTEPVYKGSWVLGLHVEDPKIWQDVLDDVYGGLSVGGTGIRQEMTMPSEVPGGWVRSPAADWTPPPILTG